MKTTIQQYQHYIFMYGILSVLYTGQFFESIEEYEECQKIIDAITGLNEKYSFDGYDFGLPTRISDFDMKECIAVYQKSKLTGVYHIENSKHYSKIIIQEVC